MANPVHRLLTPGGPESLPHHAVAWPPHRLPRQCEASTTMTLWEGRHRAARIDSDACFLACRRTIALNQVACPHSNLAVVHPAVGERGQLFNAVA